MRKDGLAKVLEQGRKIGERNLLQARGLWPEKYMPFTAEAALAFMKCCRTYNEADSSFDFYPVECHDRDKLKGGPDSWYVEGLVHNWIETAKKGQPFLIEKSRRLVVSWILRCLELWDMGRKTGTTLLAHQTFSDAEQHVWRYYHLYTTLQGDFASWKLPDCIASGGEPIKRQLTQVTLANGSILKAINQAGESFRSHGVSRACLEEFPSYDHPGEVWAQALFVSQGKASGPGGHVTAVGQPSPHPDYQEIKSLPETAVLTS